MASREEEKRARREARMAQEAKEAKAAARNKRLQLVLGGVLVVLIVVGVVIGITAAGGDGGAAGGDGDGPAQAQASDVMLPPQETADEQEAAELAGCTLENTPNEGATHEERVFTAADYDQNPPTSGPHWPVAAIDGVYEPGSEPPLGELVHTLEHGRIDVQYRPGTSPQVIEQLEAFVVENQGYHMVMFQNQTGMEAQVAATAWDWQLTCPEVNESTWDALRTFRDDHLDNGPETVP